jgi:ParB/RepB/Spo0J family partition protein
MDAERFAELVENIRVRGILQPLVVRPLAGDRYQVVAGERRYRAAQVLALEIVPVVIKEELTEEDARAISLIENLQREDLDIEDEARFLKALADTGWSLREIAAAIHKSHNYVNRRLKLLDNPAALLAYRAGRLNLNRLLSSAEAGDELPLAEAGGPLFPWGTVRYKMHKTGMRSWRARKCDLSAMPRPTSRSNACNCTCGGCNRPGWPPATAPACGRLLVICWRN